MATQVAVNPASSELPVGGEEARRRGIQSRGNFRAANFAGGDIDEQGNLRQAQAQYIRGGYAPTTPATRLSTVTADTRAETRPAITAAQKPVPIAAPPPPASPPPTAAQAPTEQIAQLAPPPTAAPVFGGGEVFSAPSITSVQTAPSVGSGSDPMSDPANSLDASAYGNAIGTIGTPSSIEGTYGQSAPAGVDSNQSFSDNADYGAPAQIGFGAQGFGTPEAGGRGGGSAGGECYAEGTPILMDDGYWKNVEDIRRGDVVALGGRVLGHGEVEAYAGLYRYKGQTVTGYHVVFEDGKFIHVEDSALAEPIDGAAVVYPVLCQHHLVVTPTHIACDFAETDSVRLTPEERLEELNGNIERCNWLSQQEIRLGIGLRSNRRVVEAA